MEFRNAHQLSLELVREKLAMNENEFEGYRKKKKKNREKKKTSNPCVPFSPSCYKHIKMLLQV